MQLDLSQRPWIIAFASNALLQGFLSACCNDLPRSQAEAAQQLHYRPAGRCVTICKIAVCSLTCLHNFTSFRISELTRFKSASLPGKSMLQSFLVSLQVDSLGIQVPTSCYPRSAGAHFEGMRLRQLCQHCRLKLQLNCLLNVECLLISQRAQNVSSVSELKPLKSKQAASGLSSYRVPCRQSQLV